MTTTFNAAATKTVRVNGTNFVYREIGNKSGFPVVFLHHLTAVLEDWDPAIADGLAKSRPVIVFDNRGRSETLISPRRAGKAHRADESCGDEPSLEMVKARLKRSWFALAGVVGTGRLNTRLGVSVVLAIVQLGRPYCAWSGTSHSSR